MSKEQLDAVRDQLLAEQDNDLRQTFLNTFLEDAEKGAGMIANYAAEKGLKLDESPKEVIEYIGNIDNEDIELTPEILASISGGKGAKGTGANGGDSIAGDFKEGGVNPFGGGDPTPRTPNGPKLRTR